MRLVLIGPPNAGKGTQARKIEAHYDIAHVSSGDILRKHVADATVLGQRAQGYMDRGELVPDDLIIDLVNDTLESTDIEIPFDGIRETLSRQKRLMIFSLKRSDSR